jgi:hypothetical protein
MFQLSQKEWESMLSQFVMIHPVKSPKIALPINLRAIRQFYLVLF